jgi:hypothetical protein
MYITVKQARIIGDLFNINFKIVNLKEWHSGLNIELEHKDVTKSNLIKTAKIAIAHLKEDPKYYFYLKKLEEKRKKHWNKKVPNIFLK